MIFKTIFCVSVLAVQSITAQCINNQALVGNSLNLAGNGLVANNIGYGANQNFGYGANQNLGYGAIQGLTNGGEFIVTSTSPIAPTGISVLAENLGIEGILTVDGQLPLLGTVAVEGTIPTDGQAGANYACGNGNVGIVNEIGGAGLGNANIGAGLANIGANVGATLGTGMNLGAGLNNGCGRIY